MRRAIRAGESAPCTTRAPWPASEPQPRAESRHRGANSGRMRPGAVATNSGLISSGALEIALLRVVRLSTTRAAPTRAPAR